MSQRSEQSIEQEAQAKGLNAPRLTPAHIDSLIIEKFFQRASDVSWAGDPEATDRCQSLQRLTICVLVLKNGYMVTGTAACVSPENYNWELGCKISEERAREQIWALEGYALRSRL